MSVHRARLRFSSCTALKVRIWRDARLVRMTSRSRRAARVSAMVNIDLGPATLLGTTMVLSGIALYQVRASRPWLSRDYDVVVSSLAILTGGILVFQGWRLDPLLLFGELLTAGTAAVFAVEALSLRARVMDQQSGDGRPPGEATEGRMPREDSRGVPLPPPRQGSFRDYAESRGAAADGFDEPRGGRRPAEWGEWPETSREPWRTAAGMDGRRREGFASGPAYPEEEAFAGRGASAPGAEEVKTCFACPFPHACTPYWVASACAP